MAKPRVLVVYKKDAYRRYLLEKRDRHLLRLLHKKHPDVREMQRAHAIHTRAIEAVVEALRRLKVDFDLMSRSHLKVTRRYDLVVSVGGDGTFLHAARSGPSSPILGVNSDPERSEAVFCAANVSNFFALCQSGLKGRLPIFSLCWLRIRLNSRWLPQRGLNDVLIAHDDPATLSRYRLRIGKRQEVQKSSGLWIATAAGSSSAVLAAGGVRLPWKAHRFQYRPRELYRGRLSQAHLQGGVLPLGSRLRITWLMQRGSAFVDGAHVRIPLHFADLIEVTFSRQNPLSVLGLIPSS